MLSEEGEDGGGFSWVCERGFGKGKDQDEVTEYDRKRLGGK
jgi:hypothetical protein